MVHERVLELLDILVQRGQVDLSTIFGYFMSVWSLIVRLSRALISCRSGSTLWRTWGEQCLPCCDLPPLTGLVFSLGGGTNMISEGDPEGLLHVMEAGMR